MSASQRPSSSRKYSIASEKPVADLGVYSSCHQLPGPAGSLSWITRYLNRTHSRHCVRRRLVRTSRCRSESPSRANSKPERSCLGKVKRQPTRGSGDELGCSLRTKRRTLCGIRRQSRTCLRDPARSPSRRGRARARVRSRRGTRRRRLTRDGGPVAVRRSTARRPPTAHPSR